MIHVLAIITAKPGKREAILKEFRANMPAVHAENGCIEYGPAVDAAGSGGFQPTRGPEVTPILGRRHPRRRQCAASTGFIRLPQWAISMRISSPGLRYSPRPWP